MDAMNKDGVAAPAPVPVAPKKPIDPEAYSAMLDRLFGPTRDISLVDESRIFDAAPKQEPWRTRKDWVTNADRYSHTKKAKGFH